MKIQFWSIGKKHEAYVSEGVDEFTGRLQKYFPTEWKIIPPVKNAAQLSIAELKKKEGEVILGMLQKDDYLIALDEKGKMWTSEQCAQMIQQRANESQKNLIFLIGGAFGIDEAVFHRANNKWSLSPLTFPHQLVRLILAEQIYRACTIIKNEKYHHI